MSKFLTRIYLCLTVYAVLMLMTTGFSGAQDKSGSQGNSKETEVAIKYASTEISGADIPGELQIDAFAAGVSIDSSGSVFLYDSNGRGNAFARTEPGKPVKLMPGIYDAELVYKDKYGVERKKWAYDLEVESGVRVVERIEFQNGILDFDISTAGSDFSPGDMRVAVYSPSSPSRTIASGTANSAIVVLEGTYDVKIEAKKRARTELMWKRQVIVKPSERTTLEINLGAAWLTVPVQGASSLPGVVVSVFGAGFRGDPIAIGEAGEYFQVPQGNYDIKVEVGKGNGAYEYWKNGIEIVSGRTNIAGVYLPVGTLKVNAFVAGGEQIPGTECTVFVYLPGDTSNAILEMNGAETFALRHGTYDLRVEYTNAQNDPSVWIPAIRVAPGRHQTLSTEIPVADVTTIVMAGSEEVPGNLIQVYYYREGDYFEPAGSIIAGAPAILEAGRYRIKVAYIGEKIPFEEWAGSITAVSGNAIAASYKLKGGYVLFRTSGGILKGPAIGNHGIPIHRGEKVLLPKGTYTFMATDGSIKTIEAGGNLMVY